jgi:protein tyrosine phosphatase (PTP) superfamily phosphohydrolase (DUF442 family)
MSLKSVTPTLSASSPASYLPVIPGQAEAATFRDLRTSLSTPIIVFCRSGNRSASLRAMSQTDRA